MWLRRRGRAPWADGGPGGARVSSARPAGCRVSSPVSPAGSPDARLRGGAPHEAERRCGARDGGAGWVGPPATRRRLCVLRQRGDQLVARRQQGSLLASSWRHRGRFPVAPARSEAEAAANAHIVVGDVSQDVVEITTGLTPRAQVLQPLRLITASLVIPIGFPPLVVRSVQHTVGRSASQTGITAHPASAGAGNRTAE